MKNQSAKKQVSTIARSLTVSQTEQQLVITWDDNVISHYSFFGLRKNCPCVSCRGGHDNMGRFEPEYFRIKPDREYEIIDVETIGRHAIRIHWGDGHKNGLYSWQLLREMSPDKS